MFWTLLGLAVLVYSAFSLYLLLRQHTMIYFPHPLFVGTPKDRDLPYEDLCVETDDKVRLHGWYVPHSKPRGTILFFHGNTGNISYCLDTLEIFHALRFNVYLFDYRGYGHSQGLCSESGTYRDAAAIWQFVTATRGVRSTDVIIYGRSLGGAIAAWLAARNQPRCLVLESSFTSMPDLASAMYPWFPVRTLARIHYPTAENLMNVKCPVLIVHSTQDELIGFSHAEALYRIAPQPKHILEIQGRHRDGYMNSGALYTAGLDEFFTRLLNARFKAAIDHDASGLATHPQAS